MKPRKAIAGMDAYPIPGFSRKGFLRLDFSENTAGIPRELMKAFSEMNSEELSAYPEYFELEKRIAEYAGVALEQVLSCNGSDSAIKIVFDCFAEKGSKAIIPWPSFSMFEQCAKASEAKIERVLFEKNMEFPTESVMEKISNGTGIVVICNPNNPTGTMISLRDIKRIAEKSKKNNALVMVDEAYFEFSRESAVRLLEKFDNIVITRTLSKAFGLAGLRLGYLLSQKENISEMRKVAMPFEVNCVAAKIACIALRQNAYMLEFVREVSEARKITESALTKLGISFFPSRANFLLARFGEQNKLVLDTLKNRGILLRDRSGYEMLEGCSRITIGTKEQMLLLARTLEEILQKPLLVFDIDGVLIDVSSSYRLAIKKTVKFFSAKEISFGEIQEFKSESRLNNDWAVSRAILEKRGFVVPLEKVIEKFQEIYLGKNFDGAILNEGLLADKNLLKRLSENAELCILTGRPRAEAEFALQNFGVLNLFGRIVCLEDCRGTEKPEPFGLQQIAKEFAAKEMFYFGDTLSDIECAKRAGFTAIGVLPPQDKSDTLKEKMLKEGAKAVIRDINKILEVVKMEKKRRDLVHQAVAAEEFRIGRNCNKTNSGNKKAFSLL